MYGKAKGNNVPSDAQARERLALYVYEYLLHVGAQKAAQTFLSEIRWDKNITLGDPPGFLHSWWCVFWDLYSAAPERRENCEHSSEAKAFHDYSSATAPSPLNSMGPADGINGPIVPSFFPPGSAASPSPHHNPSNIIRQPFMSSRYPTSGPRSVQGPGPQPILQGMDRQSQIMNMHRMTHPRGIPGPINAPGWSSAEQYQPSMGPYPHMRIANNSMPGPGGVPLTMSNRQWPNPVGSGGPPPVGQPGTPVMHPSPQDSMNPEYGQMPVKPIGHGPMSSQFSSMDAASEGVPPTSIPMSGPGNPVPGSLAVMNGMNGSRTEPIIDRLPKSSPSSLTPMNSSLSNPGGSSIGPAHSGGPVTNPHTPQDGEGDSFSMPFADNVSNNQPIHPGF